jgi:hypothetical protein
VQFTFAVTAHDSIIGNVAKIDIAGRVPDLLFIHKFFDTVLNKRRLWHEICAVM